MAYSGFNGCFGVATIVEICSDLPKGDIESINEMLFICFEVPSGVHEAEDLLSAVDSGDDAVFKAARGVVHDLDYIGTWAMSSPQVNSIAYKDLQGFLCENSPKYLLGTWGTCEIHNLFIKFPNGIQVFISLSG